MTTANAVLRRELEEARQRAGDAEQRAAAYVRELHNDALQALNGMCRKRDRLLRERDEARQVVKELVDALYTSDEPSKLYEAREKLREWGML